MLAAGAGHAHVVETLLEKGALVNAKDNNGETALIWATMNGHSEIVRLLKQAGAKRSSLTEQQQNKVIYRGNASTQIFHKPGCQHYDSKLCIAEFDSREEVIKAGFKQCKVCKP